MTSTKKYQNWSFEKFLSVKFDLKMKRTDHNRSGKFGGGGGGDSEHKG